MTARIYCKFSALWCTGGLIYILIEIIWHGKSHWTMFILGGLCFVGLGLINEIIPWEMTIWKQVLIGSCMITVLEFITGCIVNLWLGWSVWDYSLMSGNIMGQICPQYFILWLPISLLGIILDDWLRFRWWGEDRPQYKLFKSNNFCKSK